MRNGTDDHRHALFVHASNCITHCTDLVHMVEILKIVYGRSWKSREMSLMRKAEEVGKYILITSVRIYMRFIAGRKCCNLIASCHLSQITCPVVDQKLGGLEAFGSKHLYMQTIDWLPMTTLGIFRYNFGASNNC